MTTSDYSSETTEYVIPESVKELFDWHFNEPYCLGERDGEITYEICGYTGADGEMIHSLTVDADKTGSILEWRRAFSLMYNEFDPKEEALKWVDAIDRTPFDDVFELRDDIEGYKSDTLKAVLDELTSLAGLSPNGGWL